ncbi:MAG TPA: heparinase II/III family protein [Micropepsaceae bacterium]|nr:heparinase II/III family protein [Micropepsaceae bacterium]
MAMPATSLASEARREARDENAPPRGPHLVRERAPAGWALYREAAWVALQEAHRPLLLWLRQGWLYRQTLRGPVPDRILFHPADTRMRRLEDADAFIRGRFRLGGKKLDIRQGSVFDAVLPGDSFAVALHGFDWLRHLEAAGGDLARALALKLTQQWVKRFARFTPFAWRPDIIAERFLNLFAHGRFFLTNSDLVWRSRLFVSLHNQAQMLARTVEEAPDGLPRLKAAAALALSGYCLGEPRHATAGLKRLGAEIERQILPDGGHVSRSPEALLEAYRVLAMVQQALDHAGTGIYPPLRGALDRMAPMLRFFRMGGGALAVFHGGGENVARTLEATLDSDDALGRPLGHAPYSGYQRLAAGRTLVLFDAGPPPEGAFATAAHAGCLAFEMSAGSNRLIVNCGMAVGEDDGWNTALRSTPAHSTLTIDDMSSAAILSDGMLARFLGPRLVDGPVLVETRRSESPQGVTVEAHHDGYVLPFGVVHQRRMTLSPRGALLSGADRLIPAGPERRTAKPAKHPFTIRFHIHPDVRLSLAQGGDSVILKLPNGEGWRFRCNGGSLAVEESVYFGSGAPRRAEQLVVSGEWLGEAMECAWLFEQLGSA